MAINMKVNGMITFEKVKGHLLAMKDTLMKVIGFKISVMVLEKNPTKMGISMKVNGEKILNKVLEYLISKVLVFMMVTSKKTACTV